MTPERWREVRDALGHVLELPPEARAAFVHQLSVTDPELSGEVEGLLACEPDADRLLPLEPPDLTTPAVIGPYRILREAGHGGMGVVYEAGRNDGQFTQRVAIKVLTSGFASGAMRQRFLVEREILAQLEHPGIARLLDGGITAAGEPYLVMEYVDGEPLTEYARRAALSVPGRLRLFLDVCGAVSHAHRMLIVHRDLKPGNILVTQDGCVKLLDFGLARMMDPGASPEVTQTVFRLMTPAYASPEQIRGKPFGVAGDVFSLGVVLYELLSGKRPFGRETDTASEVERAVCEVNPAPLPHVPADLNTILRKALEKEPEHRYASVGTLATDISHYLEGRPISARPLSLAYRSSKFVRRNRWAVIAAAAALALIVGGAGTAVVEARRAQRRFEDVRQIANSMVFEMHDEIARVPGSTKARELLVRRGLEYPDRLSREAGNDMAVKRQLAAGYVKLGDAQGKPSGPSLGDSSGAARSYRKAIAIMEQVYERRPQDRTILAELVTSLDALAYVTRGDEEAAASRRARQLNQSDLDAHSGDPVAKSRLAASLFSSGQVLANARRYPESAAEFRQALAMYQELDRQHATEISAKNVASCLKKLGALALVSNDPATALDDYQQARAIDEREAAANPDSPTARMDLSFDLSDLGTTLRRLGRIPEAEEVYSRCEALRREAHNLDPGDNRARTALASILLREAGLRLDAGRHVPEAAKQLEEATALWRSQAHPPAEYGEAEYHLTQTYERLGRTPEAAQHRQIALKAFDAVRARVTLMPNQQAMYDELAHK
ncbi:MAG TPA: protein kinase [Candidatus Sulfopaludibacter sp.]|jgi:non-specific serine/threonine protein kinase/serine/threonine-protein kinase|nr:protein kinase [Candidatus Sulfopaludibacter sp.]